MSRVVIAGAGALGKALAAKLAPAHQVRAVRFSNDLPAPTEQVSWYQADLTTIHEAELALTGAHTVVVLAQARQPRARLQRATPEDLDRLLGDSVARAAKLVGAKHVVLFSSGEGDVREALLQHSGVPLSVLRGGGPDPVELLAAMVNGAGSSTTAAWSGSAPEPRPPSMPTCSIQRYPRPPGWKALDVARAYFKWLPSDVPLVKTAEHEGVFSISFVGMRGLVLRLVPGRSSDDCAWLSIADGTMNGGAAAARFEFRVLLDGVTTMASLIAYQPALPWPVYRFTQAVMHERVMRRFGVWLSEQRA